VAELVEEEKKTGNPFFSDNTSVESAHSMRNIPTFASEAAVR
jgi:hypothetical protein